MKKTFAWFFVVLSLLLFSCSNNTPSVDETPSSPDNPPFEVVKYTVNFSGDVKGVESRIVEEGKTVSLPEAVPIEAAKTFKGWSTVEDDDSSLINADTYTPSGDITLYAIIVDCEHAWIYDFYGNERSCALCNKGPQTVSGIVPFPSVDPEYMIDKQNNEAVYYKYKGDAESVTIPATITAEGETYPVRSIYKYAFRGVQSTTSVTISEGIKVIGKKAFANTAISSIKLPESLLYIGDSAFAITKLDSLDIPKKVRALGNSYSIIYASDELESITVESENAYFKAKDGMLLSKDGKALYAMVPSADVRIPGTVKSVMRALLSGSGILETLIIEDGVEDIGEQAFSVCLNLSSVELPKTITIISEEAFSFCEKLESITIPKSVKKIKEDAFSYCTSLAEFRYEGTVEEWSRITLSKDTDGTQNWATGAGFRVIKCAGGREVPLNTGESASE